MMPVVVVEDCPHSPLMSSLLFSSTPDSNSSPSSSSSSSASSGDDEFGAHENDDHSPPPSSSSSALSLSPSRLQSPEGIIADVVNQNSDCQVAVVLKQQPQQDDDDTQLSTINGQNRKRIFSKNFCNGLPLLSKQQQQLPNNDDYGDYQRKTNYHHHHNPGHRRLSSSSSSSSSSTANQQTKSQNITISDSYELNTDRDYIERIAKLQMDNLIPLKEDVADWLNRILNLNDQLTITVENFMDRLENGVLVCKLAKLIEDRCQLVTIGAYHLPNNGNGGNNNSFNYQINRSSSMNHQNQFSSPPNGSHSLTCTKTSPSPPLSINKEAIAPTSLLLSTALNKNNDYVENNTANNQSSSHQNHRHSSLILLEEDEEEDAKINRQSMSINSGDNNGNNKPTPIACKPTTPHAMVRSPSSIMTMTMFSAHLMKCWDNAKPHTFFARDNVSNFLEWCRRFGVKDAVLFETEDLVSNVNQRNVVLCLLEVARIACTKYSFSPAPGLVEFEQEIDREIEKELQHQKQMQEQQHHKRHSTRPEVPDKPATLLNGSKLRVCRKLWEEDKDDCTDGYVSTKLVNGQMDSHQKIIESNGHLDTLQKNIDGQDLNLINEELSKATAPPPSSESFKDGGFVDADSGSYSSNSDHHHLLRRSPSSNSVMSSGSSVASTYGESADPLSSSTTTTAASTPTPLTSELDHKVMQIAKTYYGKEARQGVQRLSEGKYKIANRIVFVRLLKARHVMVRVGGGWTTLSHFLARHGGDPNQQILPDELLPLDTKSSQMSSLSSCTPSSSLVTLARSNGVASGTGSRNYNNHHQHNNHNSSTHTLVISTATPMSQRQFNPNSSIGQVISSRYHQSHSQSHSGFNRSINSTPASRRGSVSSQSPEPLISSSSGYSSTSSASTNNNSNTGPNQSHHYSHYNSPSNASTAGSATKIPIFAKRSRLPSLQPNDLRYPSQPALLRSSTSIMNISSSSNSTENRDHHQSTPSMIPRSNTEMGSMRRYANYLRSSQHITNKSNSNTSAGVGSSTASLNSNSLAPRYSSGMANNITTTSSSNNQKNANKLFC